MVRFISAAVVLFSLSAYAQNMSIHAGPGGVSIDVREAEPQVAPQTVIIHQPPPQQVVVVQQAPAEQGMPAADFRALKQAIKAEGFEKQQLNVLQSAARRHSFMVEQVGQLIDLFDFSSGKVKVVEMTRPRIVDRENLYQLYSHFTFDSDKEKVKPFLR